MGLDLLRPLVSLFLVLNQAGSLTPFHHGFLVPRQLSSTVWDELVPSSLAAASLKTSTKHAPEQSGAARPVFPRELPIFFVKELPLPLGVKSANIIEPRYKRMIAEHSTIGLIFSDQRGFAAIGAVVDIVARIEDFGAAHGSTANATPTSPATPGSSSNGWRTSSS